MYTPEIDTFTHFYHLSSAPTLISLKQLLPGKFILLGSDRYRIRDNGSSLILTPDTTREDSAHVESHVIKGLGIIVLVAVARSHSTELRELLSQLLADLPVRQFR